MKRSSSIMVAAAALLFTSVTADAVLTARLSADGGSSWVMAPDTDGDGVTTYSGAIGNWTVYVAVGLSKPLLGSATRPAMEIHANAASTGAGSLLIQLADTDFTRAPQSGQSLTALIGGLTDGQVTYRTWADAGNVLFADTTPLTSQGPLSGPAYDSAASTETGPGGTPYSLLQEVAIVHSGSGQSGMDAGLTLEGEILVSLGDTVWHDLNRDGIQDTDEPGIEGVVVDLYDTISFSNIASTTTGPDGFYEFTGLMVGVYGVDVREETLPTGSNWEPTLTDAGTDDALDSDGLVNGSVIFVNLLADDPTIDFGYVTRCSGVIGDRVWHDLNRNGVQDDGEPGIEGILVVLNDGQGNFLSSVTTGTNGFYQFTGICAGDYQVDVDEYLLPPGFTPTVPNSGGDDGLDSDGPEDGTAVDVNLPTDDTEDITVDFGYVSPCEGSIGDYVWHDLNEDGIQDADEPGIEGVVVVLYDDLNVPIAITQTEPDGKYEFTGLCVGDYSVDIEEVSLPAGLTPTLQNAGADDAVDSDGPSNGGAVSVTLTEEKTDDLTIDFGYFVSGCYDCEGKVTQLTLQYNGDDYAIVEVVQKDGTVVFSGAPGPGGMFTIEGQDKHGTLGTEITINVGGVLNTKIHTSCSQPIGPGLVSGDFVVIEGYSREGGRLCPVEIPPEGDCDCEGKVTQLTLQYTGDSYASITVEQKDGAVVFDGDVAAGASFTFAGVDDKGTLGTEVSIYVDGVLNTRIHTSCSQPIGPGLVSGDFLVIEGYSREGGELCPVEMPPPPPPPPEDDCECEGKVTELTLQYTGGRDASIKVRQKDGAIVFSGNVAAGASFTFAGVDNKGTLGTEISIYVGCVLNTRIHTSCSQPIGPGLVSGDFLVIEGYSREGGELCPVPEGTVQETKTEKREPQKHSGGKKGRGHHGSKKKKGDH